MSKSIAATQYAKDGSEVHVHILDTDVMVPALDEAGQPVMEQQGTKQETRATGISTVLEVDADGVPTKVAPETETVEVPNMVPVLKPQQTTYSFGPMPEFTDASGETRFAIEDYVAQCEREVQALIDTEAAKPELVEVTHGG